MDSPGSCHDVAALQPNIDKAAAERSLMNGDSCTFTFRPDSPTSDPASLLKLSKPVDPKLQSVLDYIESPSLRETLGWTEFPLAPQQFKQLEELERLGYFCGENFKYDYSEAEEILAFRIPGRGHEYYLSLLKDRLMQIIRAKPDDEANDPSSRNLP